jgi:hypothetical protein
MGWVFDLAHEQSWKLGRTSRVAFCCSCYFYSQNEYWCQFKNTQILGQSATHTVGQILVGSFRFWLVRFGMGWVFDLAHKQAQSWFLLRRV